MLLMLAKIIPFICQRKITKTWLKFGSTAIGVKTNEGVVLGVEKKLPSKLMEPTKSEKLVEVGINQIYKLCCVD
jgi:20S proteasome alpha/beta subunit